jgi:hypothetical protein
MDSAATAAIRIPGAARFIVLALSEAGSVNPALGGSPNPDALDLLVRIHRQTTSDDARHAATRAFTRLTDPSRAFPELRSAAIGADGEDAFYAVSVLGQIAFTVSAERSKADREKAEAILRELSAGNLVPKDTAAWLVLCNLAISQLWPKGGRGCRASF